MSRGGASGGGVLKSGERGGFVGYKTVEAFIVSTKADSTPPPPKPPPRGLAAGRGGSRHRCRHGDGAAVGRLHDRRRRLQPTAPSCLLVGSL